MTALRWTGDEPAQPRRRRNVPALVAVASSVAAAIAMLLGIAFYLASSSDTDVLARLGVLATLVSIAGALLGVVAGLVGWTVGLVPGVGRRNLGLASALLGAAVGGFWAFVVAVIPG